MDLYKAEDRERLFQAMDSSYRKLEPFRNLYLGLLEEFVGSSYGSESAKERAETVANLMEQAVEAYTMSLAANRPRVLCETYRSDLKYFARHFSVAINNMIQEIELEKVLQQWVQSAFFSIGIVKVHTAYTTPVSLWDGIWVDPGTPMASNVSIDDWCHDMTAKSWDHIKYAADSYRVPFSDLEDEDVFDQEVVKLLTPGTNVVTDRAELLSQGDRQDKDDVEPMIDLMDVWIPKEQRIYTFAMNPSKRFTSLHGPLASYEWSGPENGPYQILSYHNVPDNTMPSPPAAQLSVLSRLANNLLRKQSRQAKRQKDVYTYTPAGAGSAKKVQRTNDGEWVEVQESSEIGVLKMGGVDAANQAFLIQVMNLYDRMAGNLSSMLGLGPQADTLGQEQLIAGNVSKKEAQMRLRVFDATRRLIRNLGFMLWDDTAKVIPGRVPIPGVNGATIDSTWTPEHRNGAFYDYDLDIDVYSMPYQPPSAKVQALNQLLTQIYLPLSAMLERQGGQVNLQALTDIYAEMLHLPRLNDVVQFVSPSPGDAPSSPTQDVPIPSSTTRNYVRQSISNGGTAQGRDIRMQQALLSKASQHDPDQAASMVSGDF